MVTCISFCSSRAQLTATSSEWAWNVSVNALLTVDLTLVSVSIWRCSTSRSVPGPLPTSGEPTGDVPLLLSPNFIAPTLRTLSPTFPVHCNGINFIRATQTGLLQTCHRLCRKHLDILRWFLSATFVICVGNFHWNFMVSWFVTVCVRDFHDLCPRHSPRGSFGESQRNGIWALPSQPATVDCHVASIKLYC